MDELLKHKIFTETDCLSEQTMFDYIDKKLSARENHAVEKHLLHCDLCSDALEGLELVKDRSRIGAINQTIITRISPPLKEVKIIPFNYKIILSVAATLLLLTGGVFFFNMLNQKNEMAVLQPDQSALSEPVVSDPPPPPPAGNAATEGSAAPQSNIEKTGTAEEVLSGRDVKSNRGQVPAKEDAQKSFDQKYEEAADEVLFGDNNQLSRNVNTTTTTVVTTEAPSAPAESEVSDVEEKMLAKDDNSEIAKKQDADIAGAYKNDKPVVYSTKDAESKRKETQSAGGAVEREDVVNALVLTSSGNKETDKSRAKEKKKANDGTKSVQKAPSASYALKQTTTTEDYIEPVKSAPKIASGSSPEYQQQEGNDSIVNFIRKNYNPELLSKYPLIAKQDAEVKFTVDKKGKVKNPVIIKGLNTEMDKELLRVLKLMPPLKPSITDGEAVSKEINLPIRLSK